MRKIQIITDSASDISSEDEKNYGIMILPFMVTMGDKSFSSRGEYTQEEFYQMLESSNILPATSQITTYYFQNLYQEQYEAGVTDLVLVLINSLGSATFSNATYAKKLFFAENAELESKFNIYVYDGMSYTGAYGEPVVRAAKMVKNGKTIDDVCQYLDKVIPHRMIYFGMYTLKFAAKSGRIPSAAAFIGEALGLKPIMKIWDRHITTAKKSRGDNRLIPNIIDLVVEDMVPNSDYQIVYGSDSSVADKMTTLMTERVGYPPTGRYQVGAAIAINAGPKVVGVIFNAKE